MMRLAACLLALALIGAGAARAGIKLIPEYDLTTKLTVVIDSVDDFESALTIGVYEDPRIASPQRLQEIIAELDLKTSLGRPVTDLTIDPSTGYFIGVAKGSVSFVGTLPDGSITISVRDPKGNFTKASASNLVWVRPDGQLVCFDLKDVDQANAPAKMSFTLLVDRSGSMSNVMPDVIATTRHFLSLLPKRAECTVASFAGSWQNHTPGEAQACGEAAAQALDIKAGGATDIYGPLTHFYGRYADTAYEDWQTAIIVITDGEATAGITDLTKDKASLTTRKGEVKTFVFWLGNRNERFLDGVADYFLSNRGDVRGTLSKAFQVLGAAYSKQQILKPKKCTP